MSLSLIVLRQWTVKPAMFKLNHVIKANNKCHGLIYYATTTVINFRWWKTDWKDFNKAPLKGGPAELTFQTDAIQTWSVVIKFYIKKGFQQFQRLIRVKIICEINPKNSINLKKLSPPLLQKSRLLITQKRKQKNRIKF